MADNTTLDNGIGLLSINQEDLDDFKTKNGEGGDEIERKDSKFEIYRSIISLIEELGIQPEFDSLEQEVSYLKREIKSLKTAYFLLSVASGAMFFCQFPNLHYAKSVLKVNPSHFSFFDTTSKLIWGLKPIFGYYEDSYFPFRYKIKSYSLISSLGTLVFSLLVAWMQPSMVVFTLLVTMINFSVCIGDVMAEGTTAVVLSLEKKLQILRGTYIVEGDNNSNFGYFSVLRGAVRIVCIFLGGHYAEVMTIRQCYCFAVIVPFFITVYMTFFFKELQRPSCFLENGNLCHSIKLLLNTMKDKELYRPAILMFIIFSIPSLEDLSNFILTDDYHGDWDIKHLAQCSLIFGIVCSILMMILVDKIKRFAFNHIQLLSAFLMCLYCFLGYFLLGTKVISFKVMFCIQIMVGLCNMFAGDLVMIPLIGRFSAKCPTGIETFGISFLSSLTIFGLTLANILGSSAVHYSGITGTNYKNLIYPLVFQTIFGLGVGVVTALIGG